MNRVDPKADRTWRKARLAARLLLRQEAGSLCPRDQALARQLGADPGGTNRLIQLTGHPTAEELQTELQHAVDLFRPNFDEASPNLFPENTRRLWLEIYHREIDVRRDIIEPAVARRQQGFGEAAPDYKARLGQ